jgi:hypothetical protein
MVPPIFYFIVINSKRFRHPSTANGCRQIIETEVNVKVGKFLPNEDVLSKNSVQMTLLLKFWDLGTISNINLLIIIFNIEHIRHDFISLCTLVGSNSPSSPSRRGAFDHHQLGASDHPPRRASDHPYHDPRFLLYHIFSSTSTRSSTTAVQLVVSFCGSSNRFSAWGGGRW